jgi:hypothetical protein
MHIRFIICLFALLTALATARAQNLKVGVIDREFPLLKVLLPAQPATDRGIEIEFPEHVTGRNEKTHRVEHLYLTTDRDNSSRSLPSWSAGNNTWSYSSTFGNKIRMTATARLEQDGLRITYRFTNNSEIAYSKLQAVTCVKLYSLFSDTLLERTYVHHPNGFDLLASETPQRLSMPLQEWLPCRYLVSYTWPVPARRVEKDEDDITRYYKSVKADLPFIATLSHDKKWIAATFTKETGNLWTNPERSCQHADPAIDLKSGETKTLELKTFIVEATLPQLLDRIKKEM